MINIQDNNGRPKKIVRIPIVNKEVGLSNSFKLHADSKSQITILIYLNGECKAYVSNKSRYKNMKKETINDLNEKEINLLNGEEINPLIPKIKGRRIGKPLRQEELTNHAKRSMRLAIKYFMTISKKISFITLSFRRIVPEDDLEGKKILKAFIQRIRRDKKNFKYVMKTELQEGKVINGIKSFRMKNDSVLHFHIVTPSYIDKKWLNENWNETVLNWAYKKSKVGKLEYQIWMNEIDKNLKGLDFKSTYLLTPNIKSISKPDRYISKYISKSGGTIAGHLWSMDEITRTKIKPIRTETEFASTYDAENHLKKIFKLIKPLNGFHVTWRDFNYNYGCYTSHGINALELHYYFFKQYEIKLFKIQ